MGGKEGMEGRREAVQAKVLAESKVRKRGGVQKSMGNKVPWKTGVLIYLPVTSRPTHFPAERSSFITL